MYSPTKIKSLTLLIAAGLLIPSYAFSADGKKNKTGLSGKFSASLSAAEGNTNTRKAKANLMAIYRTNTPWQHKIVGLLGITETSKGRDKKTRTTKNQTRLRYTTAYFFNKDNAVAAYVGRESDKKSKLKSQLMIGLGYERRNLGTENHRFTAGIGAGSLAIKYTDGTPNLSSAAALRASLEYNGKITDRVSINEKVVVLGTKDFDRKRITSEIDYAITKKASISLSHEVTIDNVIPRTAVDRRDNETSLNFNMKF